MDKTLLQKALPYLALLLTWLIVQKFFINSSPSAQELDQLLKDPNTVLVDVREDSETQEGILPGAIKIPLSKIQSDAKTVAELSPQKHYLLYCRSGTRSSVAKKIFEQHQKKATNIGGYQALQSKVK